MHTATELTKVACFLTFQHVFKLENFHEFVKQKVNEKEDLLQALQVCRVVANLKAWVHSVDPLWRGSHFRVPAHHHSNHMAFPLHHDFSDPQKHIRRTRAAHCLGGYSEDWNRENSVTAFRINPQIVHCLNININSFARVALTCLGGLFEVRVWSNLDRTTARLSLHHDRCLDQVKFDFFCKLTVNKKIEKIWNNTEIIQIYTIKKRYWFIVDTSVSAHMLSNKCWY